MLTEHLPQSQGDQIDSIMKQILVSTGYSENKAGCIIKVLEFEGVRNDVTDIRDILFRTDELIDKVKAKIKFANLICANGPFLIFFVILMTVITCCCISYCCKSKQKPIIMTPTINLSVPFYRKVSEISYDNV